MKFSKKIVLVMITCLSIISIIGYFLAEDTATPTASEKVKQQPTPTENSLDSEKSIVLDVPLENQFEDDPLENGCEVTALSMLLKFYGYDTDKNQLADELTYVPFTTESDNYGNPHEGFVGDIEAGELAMGVAVEPIAQLAKRYVADSYQVVAGDGKYSFDELLRQVQNGKPVWIVATVDLQVPTEEDFEDWPTDEGLLSVTPLVHSVVLTGYDPATNEVFVNDPYGIKNRSVAYDELVDIYQQLGQQSLYLDKL